MAAPTRSVRVKLSFENLINLQGVVPPKAWYLLDYKCLDTIADLERDVIAKYSLDWLKSIDFYVEGCFLPKWESVQLVRENDVIKLEVSDKKTKKRKRKVRDVAPSNPSQLRKKVVVTDGGDGKEKKKPQQPPPSSSSSDSSSDEVPAKPDKMNNTEKKTVSKQPSSSSDSDSDSDDEKQANISQVAATAHQTIPRVSEKPTPEVAHITDEEDCTVKQAAKPKRKRVRKRKKKVDAKFSETPRNSWPVSNGRCNSVTPNGSIQPSGHIKFDNGNEIEQCQVVVKENVYTPSPMCTPEVTTVTPVQMDTQSYTPEPSQCIEADDSWKSGMLAMAENSTAFKPRRVRDSLVAGAQVFTRDQRYKAKKNPNFSLSKAEQLSSVATNKSFIFQNPEGPAGSATTETSSWNSGVSSDKPAKSVPGGAGTDYSSYSPLHSPPSAGQLIAYKIVEMSENYCPSVSEYKEAKVISYNGSLNQLTLEIIKGGKKARTEPGKFDIPDDEDVDVEENTVAVSWSSLIDAKLLS